MIIIQTLLHFVFLNQVNINLRIGIAYFVRSKNMDLVLLETFFLSSSDYVVF